MAATGFRSLDPFPLALSLPVSERVSMQGRSEQRVKKGKNRALQMGMAACALCGSGRPRRRLLDTADPLLLDGLLQLPALTSLHPQFLAPECWAGLGAFVQPRTLSVMSPGRFSAAVVVGIFSRHALSRLSSLFSADRSPAESRTATVAAARASSSAGAWTISSRSNCDEWTARSVEGAQRSHPSGAG